MEIILNTNTIDENDIRYYTEFIKKEYSHCYLNENGFVVLVFKDESPFTDPNCILDCFKCEFLVYPKKKVRKQYLCKEKKVKMGKLPYYVMEKGKYISVFITKLPKSLFKKEKTQSSINSFMVKK